MRERLWAAPRPPEGVLVEGEGFVATAVSGLGQTLISGRLDAALAALAPGAPLVGLGPHVPDGPHALRLSRDGALLVTPTPLSFEAGWRAEGWAATRMDDGYAVIAISGPRAGEVAMQGTAVDLAAGSPSAATLFAGQRCFVARAGDGLRLHCEAPWREALLDWLAGA